MGDRGGARHPHSLAAPGSVYRVEEKRRLQRGVTPTPLGLLLGKPLSSWNVGIES